MRVSRNASRCPGDTYVVCRLPKKKKNDGWYKDQIKWNLPEDIDNISNISNTSSASNTSNTSSASNISNASRKSIQINDDGTTTVNINPLKITNTIRKKPEPSTVNPIPAPFFIPKPPEIPKQEISGPIVTAAAGTALSSSQAFGDVVTNNKNSNLSLKLLIESLANPGRIVPSGIWIGRTIPISRE